MFSHPAKAHIVASSASFPGQYYMQEHLSDTLCEFLQANHLNFPLDSVKSLFKNVEIDGRHFAFPVSNFLQPGQIGDTIEAGIEVCVSQAEINVRRLLQQCGLKAKDLAAIVSVTLTPAVPAICARLMNRINFRPETKRLPLAGLGCMAGVAGISRAADYLAAYPDQALVLLSCELSSALWQGSVQRDLSEQIQQLQSQPEKHHEVVMSVVTAALFGDGAAALLMVGSQHPLAQNAPLSIYDNRSNWIPDTEHIMGLDVINAGLRNILRPEVKTFVGTGLQQTIHPLLDNWRLQAHDIHTWTLHPGGPKIMEAAELAFQLPQEKMQPSRDALREVGNISSATVLYMLDKQIRCAATPQGPGMLVAMGPGFSQEAVLVNWN